ncbi:MFS transporter [Mycoplasma leachii]|uniref:MFS transporter n=1 Tax=Mycoplasma leachii TaxID=2105 RepID=UPI00021771E0|nr:MFS transporter [Mycoplasma leachii]CBV67121.1 Putative membrane protein [Mycoplasma leachii 99/014/6]
MTKTTKPNPFTNFINKTFKTFDKKTLFVIMLLAVSDTLVFIFPSYLRNVMSSEVISLYLGVKTEHLSQASAIYGYISLAIYFFGSILGDKLSVKWLTIIGLATFGVSGAWYGSIGLTAGGALVSSVNGPILNETGVQSRFIQLCIIYSIWAFAKIIFWAPLWKLLSQQGKPEQNGILNGIHGSFNGFAGTVLVSIGYILFFILTPLFAGKNISTPSVWNFSIMIYMFCGLIALTVILLIFTVKEGKSEKEENASFNIKDVFGILKNAKIWLVSLVVMGVYMYQMGLSILVSYLEVSLQVAAVAVFVGGLLRTYLFRFIFSAPAGKIADKTGKYVKFLMTGILIGTFLVTTVLLLPGFKVGWIIEKAPKWYLWTVRIIVYTFFLCLGALCWGLVTNRWATLFEIGIDRKHYASAVGIISVVAFTPDAWFQQLQAVLIAKYKVADPLIKGGYNNQFAYQILMIVIVIISLVGFTAGALLIYLNNKDKKLAQIQAQVKQIKK